MTDNVELITREMGLRLRGQIWIPTCLRLRESLDAAGLVIVPRAAAQKCVNLLRCSYPHILREAQAISELQGDACPITQLERAMLAASEAGE